MKKSTRNPPLKSLLTPIMRMLLRKGKHLKTKRDLPKKKENAGFSLNSLLKLYDNSIVDGRVIGLTP